VLLQEAVDGLAIVPSGTYVDCTFGGGGHSQAILSRLGPNGRLIAFDQDADAAANLPNDNRLLFVPHNFRHLSRFLRLHNITQVQGVLADLGVSSHQFDEAERGFSFRYDAPLDMRMDRRSGKTAADILNTNSIDAMQQVLSQFGEVTNARTLAQAIVQHRQVAPFATINDLLQVLAPLAKGNPNRYYAQVFQALRMEVNEETTVLKEMLEQLPDVLAPGGRAVIITFHSLEDRIVKQFFRNGPGQLEEDVIYGTKQSSPFELINKKAIEPTKEETARNSRARSARLRIAALK
jgi:16S rRNA (cytosine1402-N4)-methyltransferase